jgi:hypothetical protein
VLFATRARGLLQTAAPQVAPAPEPAPATGRRDIDLSKDVTVELFNDKAPFP